MIAHRLLRSQTISASDAPALSGAGPRWPAAAVAASVALFFCLGAALAARAGVGFDEALHAQIAVGWLRPDAAPPHWLWLPWMALTYMGTLKAFLLYGAFKLFGISPWVLRAATLSFGAAGILALMLLVRELYGDAWAAAAGLCMAADPAWLMASCFDSGPAALSVALKLIGLWLLVRARRSESRGLLFAAGLLFGLALWDKAHFLWFLIALPPCVLVFSRRGASLASGRFVYPVLLGTAVGAAPFLTFNALHPLATFVDPSNQGWSLRSHLIALPSWMAARARLLLELESGSYWADFVAASAATWHSLPFVAAPALEAAAAAACAVQLARRRQWSALRGAAFWFGLSLMIFALACLSPLPVKGHHLYILYPFPQLGLIALLHGVFGGALPRGARAVAAASLAGTLLLGSQVMTVRACYRSLTDTGGRPQFYRGLFDLAAWLEGYASLRPGAPIYMTSFLGNTMAVHTGGRIALHPFEIKTSSASLDAVSGPQDYPFLSQPGAIILLRLAPFNEQQEPPQAFLDGAAALGGALEPEALFRYSDGRPWVAAYRVAEAPAPLLARRRGDAARGELSRRAMDRYAHGDLAAALRGFDAALLSAPQDPELLLSRAVVLDGLGRKPEASLDVDEAVRLALLEPPARGALLAAEALSTRASIETDGGRRAAALADLRQALRLAPPDWPRRREAEQRAARLFAAEGRP